MTERRVLQVLGRSAGGIARHVAQITEALDGDGFRIDVVAPPDLPIEMPKRTTPVVIPNGPIVGHRAAIAKLRQMTSGYDVVHAHGLRAGIDAAVAARGGPPVLLTVHNLVQPEIAGPTRALFYRRAEALAVRLCDHTFAVSEQVATHLRRLRVAEGKIEILYLGVGAAPPILKSRAEVRAELGVAEGEPLIVTASRLSRQKALPVMLQAVGHLEKAVLAVLGTGPLEESLRERARLDGIGDRVRWLGFRDDLADYLAAANAFCLSSVWEGVPLSAQEAILLRTPVVATSVGGMPELLEDGVSGRLVPPGDPRALAAALEDVLFDPARARAFADEALARLRERFSTERMLARLRSAYEGARA